MTQEMLGWSLIEAAARIRAREVSAVELVQASLDRIAAVDDVVGAFASVQGEPALSTAARLDERTVAGPTGLGPLHGVPVAVKDVLFTGGVETAANCAALGGFVPEADAAAVARLRAAGAVVVGKSNTHELAFGVSCPASRNPWHPDRMTGGSSGGSAAALAARQVFGALGTDTGGSVRIPSSYCGTTGIKTTRGAVARDGLHMLSWTYDTIGPMARSAAGCRLLLRVIAGPSPADPYSARRDFAEPSPVEQLVLGVPDDAFFDGIEVDPAVASVLDDAVSTLSGLVAQTRIVTVPPTAAHAEAGTAVVFAEAAALQAELLASKPDLIGDDVRALLTMGAAISGPDLARAQAARVGFERDHVDVFDRQGVDLIIAPITPNQVPPHGIDELGGQPLIPATTPFTFPVNGAGLPAIALPGGIAPDGLPIGFQLIGRPFTEPTLLSVGEAFQRVTHHHARQPQL